MRRGMRTGIAAAAVLLYLVVAGDRVSEGRAQSAPPATVPVTAQTPPATPASPQRALGADQPSPRLRRSAEASAEAEASAKAALIDQYCLGCHSDRVKSGGLALSALNLDAPRENVQSAEIAEKVIRKLRGGLMPPGGARRPDSHAAAEFVSWLENKIDTAATESKPGRVPLRRLNRREYGYAIRDLLGLNIDARAWLPDDNVKGNFDNNAAALQVSPNFIDQYVYAARAVALEAIGNPKAPAETITYGDPANMVISLPPQGDPGTGRQQHHIEGMPLGTRGGFSVEHNFPADGEYELTIGDMALAREVPRMEFENTVIALLDGKEFYRTKIGGDADHKAIDQRLDPAVEEINGRLRKIRFQTTQGQHKLAITFVQRSFAESDERIRTIALEGGQERIQAAHALQIRGPLAVTGLSASPSRSKIFICLPKTSREELPPASAKATARSRRSSPAEEASEGGCARKIIENLARHAFRRPVTAEDVNPLMAFYKSGSANGGFDGGVRDALSAILASPHFLYRAESGAGAGTTRTLTDLELASRLSFFLWSSLPDEELLKLAAQSRLSKPDVLAGQVSRMLADARAKSLSDDFAFQWLHLSKLDEITPDRTQFPQASRLLDPRGMFKEELRLFIDSVLRPAPSGVEGSVFDLLTADYTFLNERLAMHYGIETVKGSHFRKVTLDNPARRGLLGKGAILMLTAYPNRTSPPVRGAWILDRLLGAPPPEPPLNVPSFPENKRGQPAKTLRARLEQHRTNPTCGACHGAMDPLGLALENFNAVGQFRANDPDTLTPIDATGQLPDGTKINGFDDLRQALVSRPDHQFVQAFTENLMTYALGRSLDYHDMPEVRRIVRQAASDDYRFKSIVLGVIASDAFRKKEVDPPSLAPASARATARPRQSGAGVPAATAGGGLSTTARNASVGDQVPAGEKKLTSIKTGGH
jgi:mono/diheme cytochrome c family protein